MRPRVLAISGPLIGTVWPLMDGRMSIGLDESSQLPTVEPPPTGKDRAITQVGEGFEVLDSDSDIGTFVNGVPVRRKRLEHGDTIRVGNTEFVFLLHEEENAGKGPVRLNDKPSESSLGTIRVEPLAASPSFADQVGWMARDLAALLRISNIINSIRDSEVLQRELLQLIFEVIPAEHGAIVLLTDLDQEPRSIIASSRQPGDEQLIEIQRELVNRAVWERSAVFSGPLSGSSGIQNVLCLPLVAVERTIGVLYLTSNPLAEPFSKDHGRFLDPVSRIAAVTLENILALDALRSENLQLKAEISAGSKLIGESRPMRMVEEFISRVAPSDSTVLIRGESGTGNAVRERTFWKRERRVYRRGRNEKG